MSRWRVAARLARREVRRHWVRSTLVVLIIAVPVLAAQWAAVAASITVDHAGGGHREHDGLSPYGRSDTSVGFDPRLGRPSEVEANPTGTDLPVERTEVGFLISDWVRATTAHGRGADDLRRVSAIALVAPDDDVELTAGRLPRTRHEAVVDDDLARLAGLDVGDDLRLIASGVDLTVVGVAEHAFDDPTAAVGPLAEGEEDWAVDALVRIRGVDQDQDQVHAEMFELVWFDPASPAPDSVLARAPSATGETLVVTAVGGTIAIGFVAVTSSVAFAIGARRQLRQLGILSAAGAGPGDLARAVVLQGSTLGVVGAVLATVLLYAGRAVGIRWVVAPAADGGPIIPLAPVAVLGLAVLGVVAGSLAALVPALTASRIPPLSALAGRRPVARRRMWSPWVGSLVLLGGLGGLAVVTAGRYDRDAGGSAAGAALAVLAVMAGVTAVSPAVIAAVARLTGRARGTARLAGRSLSRDRMRSSAVVAASAVALGLPVVMLLWTARDLGPLYESYGIAYPEETSRALEQGREQTETVSLWGTTEAIDAARDRVHDVLGPRTIEARPVGIRVEGEGTGAIGAPAQAVDPDVLRRVTGDDAVADLLEAGAVVRAEEVGRAPWTVDDGDPIHDVPQYAAADVRTVALDGLDPRTVTLIALGPTGVVAESPSFVPIGPDTERSFITRAPLSADQKAGIDRLDARRAPTIAQLEALAPSADRPIEVSRTHDHADGASYEVPWELVAVAASVLVALLVISVALALSAADGRSDDQVVAAVGAPPTVVRRRRALEAAFTAAGAAVLGIGVAGAATLIVIHSPAISPTVGRSEIRIPFVDLAVALALPVVAIGGLTWMVLAAGDRLRGRRDLFLVDG